MAVAAIRTLLKEEEERRKNIKTSEAYSSIKEGPDDSMTDGVHTTARNDTAARRVRVCRAVSGRRGERDR